jgi:hypothetical protein
MRLNLSALSYDSTWYDFDSQVPHSGDHDPEKVYLKIRPYPVSMMRHTFRRGEVVISEEEQCRIFQYSLVDWKNVLGSDGVPLPCKEEVKQKVFDFALGGIAVKVLSIVRDFNERLEASSKN